MAAPALLNKGVVFTEMQTRLPAQLELKKRLAPVLKMHHQGHYYFLPDIFWRTLLTRRILSFVRRREQYLVQ